MRLLKRKDKKVGILDSLHRYVSDNQQTIKMH